MKYTFLLISFFTLQLSAQNSIIRTPAIHPEGKEIAFSYQGDIWIYNLENKIPQRLTIHEAYESNPVYSPDGKHIAFTGNRYGNEDVFRIPRTGGTPQRLTWHSAGDNVSDWSENGSILFGTRRVFSQVEWDGEIYQIDENGGTPFRTLDAVGEMAVISPDGNKIAFVRGACRIEREAYSGPADMDIWVYDKKQNTYTQITKNEVNDYLPRWNGNNELYFLSSRNGRYNIVKTNLADNKTTEITSYKDDGVRHFDVRNGQVVFERGTSLFIIPSGGKVSELALNLASDYRFDPVERKTYSSDITHYEVSPGGKYVAMVIRGEVFVKELDKEKKRSVNLSDHPYRDQDISWLHDSALIFVSDREGQNDLYMVQSADPEKPHLFESLKHKISRITSTPEDETNPVVSPDGKQIAYLKGEGKLIIADIDKKGKLSRERALSSGWASPSEVSWSPDSRYVAYSRSDLTFNREVYIQSVDGMGAAVNISMHPRGDYRPVWSPDGSKLGFISSRNNGDDDIWFVWLKKEDWLKTKEDREEGYYFKDPAIDPQPDPQPVEEEEKDEAKPKEDKKKKNKIKPLVIDFENIHDRLEQVTSLPGDEGQLEISRDGETFYFTAGNMAAGGYDLYKVKYDGSEISQITQGGQRPGGIELDPKGDDIYYLRNGSLSKIEIKKNSTVSLPHTAQINIDHHKEREQVFEEAWKVIKQRFYDPDFHGKDWEKLKQKYKPWAMAASTSQEFRYVFNLMLGQLNASHMGLYGSNPEDLQFQRTGLLGMELMPVKEGVKVMKIVPNSPADREKSRFAEGDIIVAVGGKELKPGENFYSLLADQTENQVLMKVKNSKGETRELVIRPTRSIRDQLYEEWVMERQRLTAEYSKGRLGYIHIQGMDKPSFERFERELMASGMGKEGIVIDVRFNGGGWTTDYLMAVLNVRQHAYTIPRGAAENLDKEHTGFSDYYPYSERLPLAAWTKPSIAMCNESSYSNAEIFSHAYKTLDIGTLVGMPTFGAVISTGGAGLLDGSFVRVPFRGWYVKATGENMENGPAVPDVIIDNDPGEKAEGIDSQLKKAVEVLLKEIDEGG